MTSGTVRTPPCLHRWIKEDNDAHHTQDNQTNFHHHRATHLHISEWCMFGCLGDKVWCDDVYKYFLVWRVLTCHVLGFTKVMEPATHVTCWHVKWMKCCSLASQTSESSLVPIAPEVSPPQRRLLHQRKGGLCPWHIFLAFHQGTFALRPGPPGLVSIGELNRSPCRGTAPYTRLNDF